MFKDRCAYSKCLCCCKKAISDDKQDPEQQKDRMTRCFSGNFNKFVHRFRYVIIVAFSLLGIAAAVVASNIGPLTEPEEYLPNDHPLIIL